MFEYQKILITPDVFKHISNTFSPQNKDEEIDFRSFKINLRLKCLVLDKKENNEDLLSKVRHIISQSSDVAKNKIEILFDEFLKSDRIKFEKVNTNQFYVKDIEHNYLFNLALSSQTKIINSQRDILPYKSQINDFEILCLEDIIAPPQNSTLFSLSRIIKLTRGDRFNIYEQLYYYWINTTSLLIEDDYLRKVDNPVTRREGQFSKLIELIKACKNLKELKIKTPFSDRNQNTSEYLSQAAFEEEIKKQTNIVPQVEDTKVGERHYYTDLFEIHMGKGLDFFDISNGYKVWRPKITISITPLIEF